MPRIPYTDPRCPEALRLQVADHIRRGEHLNAAYAAINAGWDMPPELVPQSATREVQAARSTDPARAGLLSLELSEQIAQESAAMAFSKARRHWAQTTSLADDQAAAEAARLASRERQRAAFAEDRARQLMAEQATAQRAEAERQARAEWDALHGVSSPPAPVVRQPARRVQGAR